MRDLARPAVIKYAAMAAALSVLLCWLRIDSWANRPFPLWYGLSAIYLAGFVLWSFVFAWHERYTGLKVVTIPIRRIDCLHMATAGIVLATFAFFLVDPDVMRELPGDYPASLRAWLAIAGFLFGLGLLFFIFAPLAFFVRLIRNIRLSAALTLCFSMGVMMLKIASLPEPPSTGVVLEILLLRLLFTGAAIYFYLRGGIFLACGFELVFQVRHLIRILLA